MYIYMYIYICIYIYIYTGCPGGYVPDVGRMFLRLKYTDITQNIYIRSWTVTEIMARGNCGLLAVPRTVSVSRELQAMTTAALEPETTQHDVQDIFKIKKLVSKSLLFMSAATLKPIRLECYLPRLPGENKVSLFRADSLDRCLLHWT